MALDHVKTVLSSLLDDSSFIEGLTSDFLKTAPNQKEVLSAAIKCIFIKPRGVKKMDATKGLAISNREWQDFAKSLTKYLKENYSSSYKKLVEQSPLMENYDCLWPACSEKITADILKLEDKVKDQKKVKAILTGNV